MRKHIKSALMLTAAMLLSWTACAVSGIWTGRGVNGKWNNPDNWQDGIIPGKYTDDGGVERGQTGDTANFGVIVPGGQTTIDTASLYSIRNVNISGATAPAYIFGAARTAAQALTMEGAGRFTIDSSVTTTQTLWQVGVQKNSTAINFVNNSEIPFVFGDTQKGKGYGYPGNAIVFSGTGPAYIDGTATFDQVYALYFYSTSKIFYRDTAQAGLGSRYCAVYFGTTGQEHCDVEVDTHVYGMNGGWTWSTELIFSAKRTHLTGRGVISMHYAYNTPNADTPQTILLGANTTTICDIGVASKNNMITRDFVIRSGCGAVPPTIYLNSTNRMAGYLRLMDDVICGAKMIGNKGVKAEASSIPLGDKIIFEGYWTGTLAQDSTTKKWYPTGYTADSSHPRTAELKYTGDQASATDRDFVISNMWSATARRVSTNTFANAGGGKFTLNSKFLSAVSETTGFQRQYSDTAAIRLRAETNDIDFNGSFQAGFTWHLLFAGPHSVNMNLSQPNVNGNLVFESGVANMTSPSVFPYANRWQFAGGHLNFTGSGFNSSIKADVLGGANKVTLGIGSRLSISGIGTKLPLGASIDFETGSGSIVKFSDAASVDLPLSITLNGQPAMVNADGVLVDRSVRWKSAVDGNWSEGAKWTIGTAPKSTDAVYIDAKGPSYTVTSSSLLEHKGVITVGNENPDAQTTLKGNFNFQDGSMLNLNEGGRWQTVSGESWWNSKTNSFGMRGGEMEFSGTATLHITNMLAFGTAQEDGHAYVTFGKGQTTFSESSVLDIYSSTSERTPYLVVCPEKADETARLRFKNKIRIDAYYDHMRCIMGHGVPGSTSILDFELDPGRELGTRSGNTVACWFVGAIGGTGILNVRQGTLRVSNGGMHIGCPFHVYGGPKENAGWCPTGIVNQISGRVFGGSYQAAYSVMVIGVVIGAGPYCLNAGNTFTGFYNLFGGEFDQTCGLFVVGAGPNSIGFFNMTGGDFKYQPNYSHVATGGRDYYVHPMLVGFGCGKGSFTIGGGTGLVSQEMFVGGALETDIGLTGKLYHPDFKYNQCGKKMSDGRFSITGGTFKVVKDVYVGADGKGVFEVGGGDFRCRDLVLSNQTESVLCCMPTENGSSDWTANATNRLVITDGARLAFDVRRVKGLSAKWLKVVGAHEIEGEFVDPRPEIIADGASEKIRSTFAGGDVHYEHNGEKGVWYRLASASFTIYFR